MQGSLTLRTIIATYMSADKVDEEKFDISDNQCYAATSDTGKIRNDMGKAIASSRNRESRKSRGIVALFVPLLALLLARPTRRNTLFPVSRLSLSTADRSVGVL